MIALSWLSWLAGAGALAWLLATWRLRHASALAAADLEMGMDAVLAHTSGVLDAQSLEEALVHVQRAAQAAFGSGHTALLYLAEDRTSCRHVAADGQQRELAVRVWKALLHAPWQDDVLDLAALAAAPRAVAGPLQELAQRLEVDLFVAWIDRSDRSERGRLICATALSLGHPVGDRDLALIAVWNHGLVQVCANHIIARHVAYQRAMIHEVEQARAIIDNLPSRTSARSTRALAWLVHEPPRTQPESTFWDIYELSGGRLLIIAGEIIADGLAASMMSIAVRSCCDALYDLVGDAIEPYGLLDGLNRFLWRETNPVGMTCVAALFDPARKRVEYTTAGPMTFWRMRWQEERAEVELCSEPGPLVGSGPQADYLVQRRPLAPGDVFVILSQRAAKTVWDSVEPLPSFPDSRFDGADLSEAELCQRLAQVGDNAAAAADAPTIVVRVHGSAGPALP